MRFEVVNDVNDDVEHFVRRLLDLGVIRSVKFADLYVVAYDDRPVGIVGVSRLSWLLYEVKHLYVDDGHRGRGIAKALLRYVVDNVVSNGCIAVATVHIDNVRARRVFEHVGFVPVRVLVSPISNNVLVLYMYFK